MYPKRFTFDPRLIERARIVTLRSPDLNVLRDENWAELPGLAHFLEQGFKARDAEGKLLLPDLSALANWTVGIFSDYGGEDFDEPFLHLFLSGLRLRFLRTLQAADGCAGLIPLSQATVTTGRADATRVPKAP